VPCPEAPTSYQGRKVNKVSITSPLYFFFAANYGLTQLAQALPVKKDDPFDVTKYSLGAAQITTTVRTTFIDGFSAMRFVVTAPRLENCTADNVDIHYIVYTSVFPPLSGHSFETRQAELERPSTTGAALGTTGRFLVVPDFEYNHTRRGYGGMAIRSDVPFSIFDHFEVNSAASSDSLTGALDLSGERTTANQFLNRAEWHLRTNYRDVPAGPLHLKEGKVGASFFGTSKEVTSAKLLVHFGGALAGGHQQGVIQDAPNSPYGDLKFVGGVEGQRGSSAFAASYGLQLGSTFQNRTVDFAKHILDVRYNGGWSPMPKYQKPPDPDDRPNFIGTGHKPITLEARFNAGIIQTFGQVPGSERFFGGNQQLAPFIDGQPWDVRGEPFIRSISENKIGSSNPSSGFGGTRFYSANLTFSKAVFGKALLPKELATKDFVQALDVGIKTAKGELSDTYYGKDPQVVPANDDVSDIREKLKALKAALPTFSFDAQTNARISGILNILKSDINSAVIRANTILDNHKVIVTTVLMNTSVPKITVDLDKLRQSLTAPDQSAKADQIKASRDALDAARTALVGHWGVLDAPAARARADARADKDFAIAEKVLRTFLYQLNTYSIAPVGVFDVARVWPSGVGTRYAIGGGVRMSLVVANFTVGYAANPSRRSGEGPGALFFKLDVTNLFH
jgi:hypothetical protein